MSGLLSILRQGAMSLQTQQAYSSTVAHNLSNANTPGFSRQSADIAAAGPADRFGNAYIGRGAVLQAISQSRDRFVEQQMSAALGSHSKSSTEASLLQGVSALNPDAGLTEALTGFYGSLRALAQNAGNPSVREATLAATARLAVSFNQTANALESARAGADSRLEAQLPELNDALAQIARLNAEVAQARVSGGSPNDLLDARQRLVDRVSSLTGAVQIANDAGDANLTLPSGTSLVQGNLAASLSAKPDAAIGSHLSLWITTPAATSEVKLPSAPGGELGGIIGARDGAMAAAQSRLDQLAFDFGNAVNAVSQTGFALDGSTGHSLFTVSATSTGAASTLAIDPTVAANASLLPAAGAAGAPGDGSIAQAMVNTESLALSGGKSAESELASLTSSYGATTSSIAATADADEAVLANLEALRQSVSGVSVDEELVNMQRSQRAYEAVTRVIKTADSMLETLLALR